MPAVLMSIIALVQRYFLARILVGAGLTLVTYPFVKDLLNNLQSMLGGYLYSIPANFLYIIDLLNFDFYLSVLMNCYAIAIGVKSAKMFFGRA